ncbi:polyprenol monophosphomannose synthase [Arthrobacter cupressi]|uniref:Dolichol-phosphate mannosyltransferase n=1 Tax=Arthrobacter cupressi TaxID=1045773 RepID=A0A1G8WSE9_9MICC|nr:polyprenol monophosphomannose synthase [Arthrobacter cupressi]NYD79871.1 dolichol-phosphate mannosyltransferase [Arthrobacter cupressi]SDJ80555.1 dolichol-phosphate mannosyltransferase [Arthrobacter cupressi]
MRVLTIIPTYNELESLPKTLGRLRAAVPGSDVLVVDDNSPDGTGQLADSIAAEDKQVHVLHRKGKEGLGAAYIAGFKWGMAAGYDVLVEMDADGSHKPEQLPLLLTAVEEGADLAMGSRWVPGGSVVNWPLYRQAISRIGSTYARIMLGVKIKDVTGGYRAFRRSTLEALKLDEVESVGYGFQVDLAWRVAKLGLKIVECPITFVERELGASKMSGNIVVEAMINVTKWGLSSRWAKLTGKKDAAASRA